MYDSILTVVQIVFADIVLSGDNAIVIGMAASGVLPEQRRLAIMIGLALAALLRIIFAVLASTLMGIPGILFVGGVLLSWVCWRFYRDIREHARPEEKFAVQGAMAETAGGSPRRQLRKALITITAADVSMSLDNVLAVAAIARDDKVMLFFGLALAIGLMALCATMIMRILIKFPVLSWAGLLFLAYLSLRLLYEGGIELMEIMGHA